MSIDVQALNKAKDRLKEIEEKIRGQATRARLAMPDFEAVRVYISEAEAIDVAAVLGEDPKFEGSQGEIFLQMVQGMFQYTDEVGPIMVEVRNLQ